jgi:hypothetical protein
VLCVKFYNIIPYGMPVRQWKGSVCYCLASSVTWLYWESAKWREWATNWDVPEHHVVEQCWDGIEHTHIQAVRQHKQQITSVCYQSLHRAHKIWVFIGPLLSLGRTGRQGRFCLENWNRDKSFVCLLLHSVQGKNNTGGVCASWHLLSTFLYWTFPLCQHA